MPSLQMQSSCHSPPPLSPPPTLSPFSTTSSGSPLRVAPTLDRYESFIFDCDGVLWTGSQPIPGSVETLKYLHNAGKQLLFITNNASKSRMQYQAKFAKLGPACEAG